MGRWDDKFERHAKKWETWNVQEYSQHDRVLSSIIEDKAKQFPDHVAFQFRDDPITLEEFNARVNQAANGFLELGVQHGDKVAIMLPNNPEFLYVWFGLNKIGACEVPVNVALKGQGLAYQMVQSDCVALVADLQYLDRLEGVAGDLDEIRHIVYTDSADTGAALPTWPGFEHLGYAEFSDRSQESPGISVHYSDLASILYTSGTTGVSKGVMFSHHYWYDIWAESVKYSRYTEDDVLYTGLPFFHGNAQGITVGPAILADAKAVIVDRFSASLLWDDCRRWECTEANYIGGIIPILLKQEERENDGDNPVRLMVGAAAPQDEWHVFQERFNTKILEVYGMTECYCSLVSLYDEPRAGACGKTITGWDVRIVDDDDNECEPGKLGEFIARSNKMFVGTTGYYNKPEATLELFQNGWIHTGDLGRMDEDGYFFFVDRKKQAIRRRGENISSFEVESVISSHDAVLESAVVGVPSDVGEEEVKAVVVCKEGQSVTEEELIRWCEPRMAYFAIPRYIAIRDSMPKTPSERVEKFKLKDEGITADCWDREAAGIELAR
ncbi:MAG: ATP-dependent acyl-CoA ligase [Kiritimatiellia bacterium]|jgi:crotonobetaine/carnitine-CoA ligase|nr:ATP-dependent acyl-CoA ligase [Pseudomonadales bacterium]MDP7024049.1 ATP-dependent acyl-CoA ligase [Kiritimatiellia bacterium]|tara:strand:- start:224 stop:1885 length:1662 start_codon:yes stop_codon:yes gene_type:complete